MQHEVVRDIGQKQYEPQSFVVSSVSMNWEFSRMQQVYVHEEAPTAKAKMAGGAEKNALLPLHGQEQM